MNLVDFDRPRWVLFLRALRAPLIAACLLTLAILNQPASAATLLDLFNGGSITVGNLQFSDWQLLSLDATASQPPDFSLVEVLPFAADPLNPGVQFIANGQLATTGLNSIDLNFRFRANILTPGLFIAGNTLELTGVTFSGGGSGGSGGIVFISEEITRTTAAGDLASAVVIADNGSAVFDLLATSEFPLHPAILVTNNLFVMGLSGSDAVSLNTFTQRFSLVVPEPATALLTLAAVSLFAATRRSR